MYLDIAWKVQRQPNSITLDGGDAHNPYGVAWVANHYFFTFSSRNYQHRKDLLPSLGDAVNRAACPDPPSFRVHDNERSPNPLPMLRTLLARRSTYCPISTCDVPSGRLLSADGSLGRSHISSATTEVKPGTYSLRFRSMRV